MRISLVETEKLIKGNLSCGWDLICFSLSLSLLCKSALFSTALAECLLHEWLKMFVFSDLSDLFLLLSRCEEEDFSIFSDFRKVFEVMRG